VANLFAQRPSGNYERSVTLKGSKKSVTLIHFGSIGNG